MDFIGSYQLYKSYTSSFISWISKVNQSINNNKKNIQQKSFTITDINNSINNICKLDFLSLTNDLQSSYNDVMSKCEKCITLRKEVSLLYLDDDREKYDKHLYFINCLKSWKNKLLQAFPIILTKESNDINSSNDSTRKLTKNRYESLDVDESDSYVLDDVEFTTHRISNINITEDNDYSFKLDFEESLAFELHCFMNDVDYLYSEVAIAWLHVKEEKQSIFTATIITNAAIQCIQQLSSLLEVNFPAIKSAESLLVAINKYLPSNYIQNSALKSMKQYEWYCSNRNYNEEYVKGSFINEFYFISMIIKSFKNYVRGSQADTALLLKEGIHGKAYDENSNPILFIAITNLCGIQLNKENDVIVVFLMKELSVLFNTFLMMKIDLQLYGNKMSTLLNRELFNKSSANSLSIPLVFAILCWCKSTQMLQGNNTIKRHISYANNILNQISREVNKSLTNFVKIADEEVDKFIKLTSELLKGAQVIVNKGCCNNPYLAYSYVIDIIMYYLHAGCESFHVTSRFRAFGHLYNILLNSKVITSNTPFIDELLVIYDKMIFHPSRPVDHNDYVKVYLLSSHLTINGVNQALHGKKSHNQSNNVKIRNSMHLFELSQVNNLLYHDKNLKNIKRHNSLSIHEYFRIIKNICFTELFQTRVLSRLLLSIHDHLYIIFEHLTDLLNRRDFYNNYILHGTEGENQSRQYRINRAGEDAVMLSVLAFIDDNAFTDINSYQGRIVTKSELKTRRLQQLQPVADYIVNYFQSLDIEKEFYLLPTHFHYISDIYGTQSITNSKVNDCMKIKGYDSTPCFCKWMDRFEDDPTPLNEYEIIEFKNDIKYDPWILCQFDVVEMNKPNIFHHIASGPHANIDLAIWCINMGCLMYERMSENHDYIDIGLGSNKVMKKNKHANRAISNVVKYESLDMLKTILQYDDFKLLNYKSPFDDYNTVTHLAIKYGKKDMYDYLKLHGAKLSSVNEKNEKIYDMTNDRDWKTILIDDYNTYVQMESYIPPSRQHLLDKETETSHSNILNDFNNLYAQYRSNLQPQRLSNQPQPQQQSNPVNNKLKSKQKSVTKVPMAMAAADLATQQEEADKAAIELLEILEKEEQAKKNKNKKQSNKKSAK